MPAGETDPDGRYSVEHVECIGACGGAPAVQVNYELVEGVEPDKARELVRWLAEAEPPAVNGDEMQALFGGQRSFDWGPAETTGAARPVPSLGALGTAGDSEGRSSPPGWRHIRATATPSSGISPPMVIKRPERPSRP